MNSTTHDLQAIATAYQARFLNRYGHTLSPDQWSAFNAIVGCRQGQYGELHTACSACPHAQDLPRSCGHRACNQCQSNSTQEWLDRQLSKQLPVNYYMATFTLPFELRQLAKRHRKTVYRLLLECAVSTLKTFGMNKPGFEAQVGLCAVLHTHTRRLDYHPHVHIVVPGGGVHRGRKEWRKVKGKYLFNGFALAKVFRGKLLKALADEGLKPNATPKKWVVHCDKVGKGKEALRYLSRYLYRGVIANKNIIADDGDNITFQYINSTTNAWETRTLSGEDFLHLILQHVLPKGFRRARDYGFLHGNAKALLRIVQWILNVHQPIKHERTQLTKRGLVCRQCGGLMNVIGMSPARPKPG